MKATLRSLIVNAALGAVTLASAQSYWYNGDFDGVTGLASYYSNANSYVLTYDNFRTPNPWGLWTRKMTSNFGTFTFSGPLPTQAYAELRTGMGIGNPGSLVASYTLPVSVTATGRGGFGMFEYKVALNTTLGFMSIFLQKNRMYWLAIAPILPAGSQAFVASTDGANRGPANDGMPAPQGRLAGGALVHAPVFGLNYASAQSVSGSGDFSYGVGWN